MGIDEAARSDSGPDLPAKQASETPPIFRPRRTVIPLGLPRPDPRAPQEVHPPAPEIREPSTTPGRPTLGRAGPNFGWQSSSSFLLLHVAINFLLKRRGFIGFEISLGRWTISLKTPKVSWLGIPIVGMRSMARSGSSRAIESRTASYARKAAARPIRPPQTPPQTTSQPRWARIISWMMSFTIFGVSSWRRFSTITSTRCRSSV